MTLEEFQKAKSAESDMHQLLAALTCVGNYDEYGMCHTFDMFALPEETLEKVIAIVKEDYTRKKIEFEEILNGEERDAD